MLRGLKKEIIHFIILFIVLFLSKEKACAQCSGTGEKCIGRLNPFQNEGQYFRAKLADGEEVKIKATFFTGMAYRLVPCNLTETNEAILFTIFDRKGTFVFTNKEQPNKSYYDFTFGATGPYTIALKLEKGAGCAALLVGYLEEERAEELLKK